MERELIAELAAILGSPDPVRVPCGIGDDTALLSSPGSGGLLLTTDSQREGVHFTWDWIAPESVGYRLVVANVSDIASKGGRPYAGVVAVGLPQNFDADLLKSVYRGIAAASREYDVPIVGGDLSRETGGWNFVMTLLGVAEGRSFPKRSGLNSGDSVYLLGRPGRARAGFLSLQKGRDDRGLEEAKASFRRPRALLAMGQKLALRPEVTATIDSSDGLERSLLELARASGVSIGIESLPVTPEISGWADLLGEDPGNLVWTGGEDYDLVLGIRSESGGAFESWAKGELFPGPERVHYLGKVTEKKREALFFSGDVAGKMPDSGRGFDHTSPP